jgi:hypothetical protein
LATIEPAYCGVSDALKEREIFVATLAIANIDEGDAFLNEACSEPGQKEHLQAFIEAEGSSVPSSSRRPEQRRRRESKIAPARPSARTSF